MNTRDMVSERETATWPQAFGHHAFFSAQGHDGRYHERGTLILDVGGVVRYGDEVAAEMFGMARDDLVGLPAGSLIPLLPLKPGTPGYNVACCHFHFSDGQWRRFLAQAPGGRRLELEVLIEHVKLPKVHEFILSLRYPLDHSAHLNGDLDKLRRSLDAREEMALITDRNAVIQYVNPAFETVTGYEMAELLGKTPHTLSSGAHDDSFYAVLWGTLRQGRNFSAVLTNRKKSGELYHQESSIRPFLDEYGRITHFVLTAQDISQRIHALGRLEHLAHHDYLTALPNRALFLDRLGQSRARAMREQNCFALLYLDLDGFKQINDEAGHGAGDALLRNVATHLSGCVREEDTVARIGGDEFACILSGVSGREDARKICHKILDAVRQASVVTDRQGALVTASIGLAFYPGDGQDEASLLDQADRLMYQAKADGGDRCCCSGESHSGHPNDSQNNAGVLRWQSCKWR
ncbi:MAG: diguanylate cyclase [Rhodocyclaceae bacterium]|nr:diguanylate cyclase [Rhodocyclaceae bacterium]